MSSVSIRRVKWFQLSVIFASLILLFLLVASVVIAHWRVTGSTGVDAGDIQQIRGGRKNPVSTQIPS